MNFTWPSQLEIPKELSNLKDLNSSLNIEQNFISNEDIQIIPLTESEQHTENLRDYFLWIQDRDLITVKFYKKLKETSYFLGVLGPFLNQEQLYNTLKTTQDRKIKNLRQAEIIQRAKSQNLLIEKQVNNLNSEVEVKTRQLFEFRDQLESQVFFEKDSILILKNLLEASSFESFNKVLHNAFKRFYVQNLILFFKDSNEKYKIQSQSSRLKKYTFTKDEILNLDKKSWADISTKPVLEFRVFPIGNDSNYLIGFEFSSFNLESINPIKKHIEYLQYIFKMILDFLFDQEKIISDSVLWSNSFNSLDDPLLIIDEFYKVVKSNINSEIKDQKCFKVLFNRTTPCEYCPIKKSHANNSFQDGTINLEDKYNLHSFPVEVSENLDQKLWIHHYESTSSINDLRAQYIKSEKFSYLGQLVDKVIHQIANPLTGMRASVEFLLEGQDLTTSLGEDLSEIQGGLVRCFEIINNLKQFSASEAHLGTIDLSSFVRKTLTLMKSVTRDISFELEALEEKNITCPIGLVQQVLFNIIYNSCQAMNFVGKIKITAFNDGFYTNLVVSDTGPGIHKDLHKKIFDPFFSTKSKDHGTGIGLFLSQQIIRQFGGDIVVMNSLSPGAHLCIKFPLRIK